MKEQIDKILIVDDEPIFLDVLENIFDGSHYEIESVTSGKEALQIIRDSPNDFSLILCDVVMPEMDGYQFCQKLRSINESDDIPFIFSTSLTTLDDKIKGYNVGADDYLIKPVLAEELLLKIEILIKQRQNKKELNTKLNDANAVAMQAMTYSSDLGKVVNFYEEAMLADSFDDLALRLFSLLHMYDLKCSLYIDTGIDNITIADGGYISPLEIKVFEQAKNQGRFFDFGCRTLVNYDNHSLLIKNMPIEDEEKYGLIKDIVGALCNAVSAKLSLLISEINNARQKRLCSKWYVKQ